MILAIVFAQLWGVIQLIVLGSLTRTVRVRTVLVAMAVGLYAIAPLAVILQKSWIGVAAALVGKSMAEMTGIASYTVDPFIEEALKLLPLALLMLIPAIRRQWSLTDCVLIAAAIGSGFGLAEHMYRYASSPDMARGVSGGWAMSFADYTPMVSGIASSLTTWLPNGVWFPDDATRVNWHLAWSAIGGLALGLAVRNPKRAARVTAGGLFLLIGLDHAAGNTHDIGNTWLAYLAAPLDLVTNHLGLLAFIAIVVACWLDRSAQGTGESVEPLLAAERSASSRIAGTFTAAISRLPWSIPWVCGFDRARRAYHSAHASAPESVDGMLDALVAERDRVDQKLAQPEAPKLIPSTWTPAALRSALRRRPVIISLVLLAPSVLYLIIGGWPQTAWVQTAVTSRVVWPLVILITVAAQARLVWSVVLGTRNLGKASRLPIGDDAAILGLQLACGIGSVALGGFTLLRVFSGVSAGSTLLSHAHAADAANRLKPGGGVSVANSGGAFDPPPPSLDLPDSSPSSSSSDGSTDSPPAADKAPPPPPKRQPPPPPPQPTPQEKADRAAAAAAAAAAQADADAAAAQQHRIDAINAQDAADIKRATTDHGVDPDVAAARQRTHDAEVKSEAADNKSMLDGDDPWDPNAKSASDAAHDEVNAAHAEEGAAENSYSERQQADADAAKAASEQAQNDLDAANAKAGAAHEGAAKAANNAAAVSDPEGAAADAAAKNYADAQAHEAKTWYGNDNDAYEAAREATRLAKEQADAAQAAADAARKARSDSAVAWRDKP
jgi:RsiW-degrading membrane proteinase PrsW (M82 family)